VAAPMPALPTTPSASKPLRRISFDEHLRRSVFGTPWQTCAEYPQCT
jgi:hypothetical protein